MELAMLKCRSVVKCRFEQGVLNQLSASCETKSFALQSAPCEHCPKHGQSNINV